MAIEFMLCADPNNRSGLNADGEVVVKIHPIDNNRAIREMTEAQLQLAEDHAIASNSPENAAFFQDLRERVLPIAQNKLLSQIIPKSPRLTTRFH